jgi:hypothetical protein
MEAEPTVGVAEPREDGPGVREGAHRVIIGGRDRGPEPLARRRLPVASCGFGFDEGDPTWPSDRMCW